jgi:uncharacterized repeat protein (TIGR01451 family)
VQLKDSTGNALTVSGGTVALSTTLGTLSAVTNNNDGTYTATLTPPVAGTATVSATLNGAPLSSASTVAVSGTPSLAVSKTPLATPTKPLSAGTPTGYEIVVINLGTAATTSATILETISAGLQLNSIGGTGWTCTYINGQPLALPAKGQITVKCVFDAAVNDTVSAASSSSMSTSSSSSNGVSPKGGTTAPVAVSVTPLPGFLGTQLTTASSTDQTGGNNPPPPPTGSSCPAGTSCATSVAEVVPESAPTVSLGFDTSSIPVGGQTRLTTTLINKTGIAFSALSQAQALPSGLAFLADPKPLTNCNGTASVSGGTLTLSGGSLAAGGSCSFSALVTSSAPSGSKLTVITPVGAIKNAQNKSNETQVSADLLIDGSFAVRKSFQSSQAAVGVPFKMTVAIDNTGAVPLTSVSLTDALPTAPGTLIVADEPKVENTCAGTLDAVAKSSRIALSGGTVPVGGCSFAVMLQATEPGDYLNEIPQGGTSGSPNGLQGKLSDGSALASTPGASARINVDAPSTISGVFYKRIGFGQQVPQAGVTVVLKDAEGRTVATTTTQQDGSYIFENLPPSLLGDAATKYTVEFVVPGGETSAIVKGDPEASDPTLNGQPKNNGIAGITLKPGSSTPAQNGFLIDPSGVVYDSITRRPVAGARVTLIGPDGAPVPNSLLDLFAGTTNGAAVGSNGLYVLLLTSEAPSGVYRLRVDVPNGYQPGEATGNSAYLPAAKTPYVPALGGGIEKVQPQETAPTLSEDTGYYMSVRFVITDRPETSSNGIIHNHIPIDPVKPVIVGELEATKLGSAQSAELGDSVGYMITLKNATNVPQYGVVLKDTMPIGFKYIGSTSMLKRGDVAVTQDAALGVKDGERVLNYNVGTMLPGDALTLSYRARVGVGSARGDGINRATASSLLGTMSNEARYGIRVDAGVFSNEACVIGAVYRDYNDNGVRDQDEPGVAGVRLYFSDGAYMVSDQDGRYSLCGRRPSTQALKVDPATLPEGSVLGSTSNRDAGDPGSLFLDLKNGEMHRADFRIIGRQAGNASLN